MAQKLRVPLGFVIAAVVIYLANPTPTSIMVGFPIALAGVVLRALAAGVIKKDMQLATSGIYAHMRNPLYLGTALLVAGFSVMSASNLAATILMTPFIAIYPTVVLREEAHLAKLFPDEFRLYKSKVPRFFPRPTFRFRPAFSWDQYLSNGEYNTALGFAAVIGIFTAKWWLR